MTFLSSLATTLIQTYGNDLSQVTVVFPNKRAALFLNEELVRQSDRPLWSPAYTTISDLFRSQSDLEVADPIKLICDLHKSFVQCTGIEESLDHFYGWGQLLLSDFDDVDKHLAPADKVFANLRDIHEFDDDAYLTQQQRDIIRKFFSNFNEDHNSELKQRFLSLWSHIYDIYLDFNKRLTAQGLAYEGALYRQVIETLTKSQVLPSQNNPHDGVFRGSPNFGITFDSCLAKQDKQIDMRCCLSEASSSNDYEIRTSGPGARTFGEGRNLTPQQYIFAGFNLLHPVEKALIHHLETEGKARLIQDTDEETPKEISIISAPTNNIQARYVSTWLKEHDRIQAGRKTAIVLADESLLQGVIHNLPDEISKANITIGYPLSQTATARGTSQDISVSEGQTPLSKNNPHDGVFRGCPNFGISFDSCLAKQDKEIDMRCCPSEVSLSNDSEIRTSGPGARTFLKEGSCPPKSPLELEARFRLQLIFNRLQALIDSGDLQVEPTTLQRLLTQIIASTTIPFHGEPLEGIQVMGVLETRNIDFDHVLLLSCNEGNIPKGINDTSFIPYSIRKAYGLTTADNKVSIYENYFRRLLQRAKDVTLVYNNATNDGKTGEMSRFMLQLMVESNNPITYLTLQGGQTPKLHHPQPITKTPAVMERLKAIRQLSPSALARYLRCPLRFFYQDVCKLSEYEDQDDDRIDNRLFGNIFHKAAQLLYTPLMGLEDAGGTNLDRTSIYRAVDEAIKLELFHLEDPTAKMPPLNGLQLINREVIIKYLHQLLEIDRQLAPFTILALETSINTDSGQVLPSQNIPHDGVFRGCPNFGISFDSGLAKQDKQIDMRCCPSEASSSNDYEIRTSGPGARTFGKGSNLTIYNIGGIVDRIDKITLPDGTERIRIIDYKTSNYRPKPLPDVAAIFDPANIRHHSDYYLQSFLYSLIVEEEERNNTVEPIPVSPCLLFIQHAGTDNYDPTLVLGKTPVTDISTVKDEFLHHLNQLLAEIYDPDKSFLPTEDLSRCSTCPFHHLCG